MDTFQIDPSKIGSFMYRYSMKFLRDMSISLLIFLAIIAIFSNPKVPLVILSHVWHWVLGFYLVLFLFSFLQQNVHLAKRFIITEDTIYQIQDSGSTNMYNDMMLKRMEHKTGQRRDQIIPFEMIRSIKINKNRIQIKSKDFDPWNANGKIEIPIEVNNYEDALQLVREINDEFEGIEFKDKSA